MARRNGVLLPIVALVLGLLAIGLSFIAYSKRIKVGDVSNVNGVCRYPSSPAFAIGIIAALVLLIEQITISVGMRCFCCCGIRCSSKCGAIISIILFIFSWFAFVIAFIGLIYTAMLNNRKYLVQNHSENNIDSSILEGGICYIGKENLFLGDAVWCIFSIVSGLFAYSFRVCATRNRNNNDNYQAGYGNNNAANYGQTGVAMGQPPHSHLSKDKV
ncbi:hypothetical protein SOVF_116600 [Spinacia oleracea]|uniref:Protein VASCULATURE COMPLEXITY AND CONNECTIVITY n=1 Tax=Spinacia oleracea TaxID=3562 RepID=A0A9R0JQD9_SPIOL|nr:protein VASCULATURE COMPLEXITY AND CONNECTIVITY-like [Spinacia oleracea]KNA13479.1 hypothetical protein SOVF_116600 [Spinacia oleracea]